MAENINSNETIMHREKMRISLERCDLSLGARRCDNTNVMGSYVWRSNEIGGQFENQRNWSKLGQRSVDEALSFHARHDQEDITPIT
jgi:hypothetical protein